MSVQKVINYRQCEKCFAVNLLSFYELKFQATGPPFFFYENVFRPWFIAPAFVRFRFVSYSRPLSTLLRNSTIFVCRQQNDYTASIESGGSHACGAGVVRRLISGLGVNSVAKDNLSGYCCDVMFELSWLESQHVYWLSCKFVTSRLEM